MWLGAIVGAIENVPHSLSKVSKVSCVMAAHTQVRAFRQTKTHLYIPLSD